MWRRACPDCADFVYFLRAYFAYKMGLPFGYSNCSRGMGGRPPKCYQWFDIDHPEVTRPPPPPEQLDAAAATPAAVRRRAAAETARHLLPLAAAPTRPRHAAGPDAGSRSRSRKRPTNFAEYLRDVGDVVHTGAVRVVAADDNTDFYTVPLTKKALRPGTVYADPYGHVLMMVHLVPEANGTPGVFLAVDAEPDGSITRKRFWRGNFLFVHDPALGSPGFKHFRPIVGDKNGPLRRLTNAEIAKNPQYGDFSLEQSQMSAEDFYDRMDDVMSPEPLDPVKAMTDAIASLYEQVKMRVTSVENGRKYQEKTAGITAMPDGPSIFETTGAWEDYSTPARDFRLLIAIDVVRNFPDASCGGRTATRSRPARASRTSSASCRACSNPNWPAQAVLYPQRRLAMDAVAQGRDRPGARFRDGLQPERLRRAALGRAREQRRSLDLQAARAAGPARQDGNRLSRLVPRTALADA